MCARRVKKALGSLAGFSEALRSPLFLFLGSFVFAEVINLCFSTCSRFVVVFGFAATFRSFSFLSYFFLLDLSDEWIGYWTGRYFWP